MKNENDKTIENDVRHRHPEIEHFLNLNTILHSLVDFIRPETFISQEELETYNELKDKYLHDITLKRNQQQQNKSPLETSGVQTIRTTSGIYRFLAHHHKNDSSVISNKQKSTNSFSREELLKKLHEKMPHRQQQKENGIDQKNKRKRTNDKPNKRETKIRKTTNSTIVENKKNSDEKPSTISNQITFGRFEFNSESSKKKKFQKLPNKQKQLINTLKKIETEQNELNRLKEENPDERKEILRSKNWTTALAKAKGEKIRDNPQLLRKTIKKQAQLRQHLAKKWQQRNFETNKRKKEREEKRKTNLQKRKDDKKAKLKKKLIKKGRLIS